MTAPDAFCVMALAASDEIDQALRKHLGEELLVLFLPLWTGQQRHLGPLQFMKRWSVVLRGRAGTGSAVGGRCVWAVLGSTAGLFDLLLEFTSAFFEGARIRGLGE